MRYSLFIYIILFSLIAQAQVGIGTTTPTAHLQIVEAISGLPALELNPQASPAGTATGQLAVIDDKLYMYDNTRGKWLSVELTILSFGLLGGADNQELEFEGDVEDSGPLMPFDGTIIGVAMNASGGQADKQVQLYKNDVAVPTSIDPTTSGLLTMNTYSFISTDYNLDFNAGDWFRVEVTDLGSAVQNISVVLKIKWRE